MKHIVSFTLILFFGFSISAQNDFGLWSGIAIEKELSKKFDLKFEEELRLEDNITRMESILSELSIEYKINKYYRTSALYRFTYNEDGSIGNRLTWGNSLRYKLEDFTFNYRLNFQTDFNTRNPIEYKLRNRIGVDYKFNKRWEIGVSGELFYSFYYNRNVLDRYRLAFGADYNFNKHHRISPGLMFQSQINTAEPRSDLVFRISYKYSF